MHTRILALALCAACASPREATHRIEDAEEHVLARSPEPALVERALELADLEGLGLNLPTPSELADPTVAGYWYGAAYAFAPPVREARARALAALGREGSAGAPGPIGLRVMDHEFGGEDTLAEGVLSFDLIGLLGVGPSAAKRGLARSESVWALSELELALFDTHFAVDRARASAAGSAWLARALSELLIEAQEDLPRVQILEEHGRLGAGAVAGFRGAVAALRVAVSMALDRQVQARANLAGVAGLPIERAVDPDRSLLDDYLDLPDLSGSEHPQLRGARLRLSVAEARLREVACRAWPGLDVGPHLGLPGGELGDLRLGGLLGLRLPLPSSYGGEVEAAEVLRDRALERYGEVWLSLKSELEEASLRWTQARERQVAVAEVGRSSSAAWAATRASFRAGRSSTTEWTDALARRVSTIGMEVAAAEDTALFFIDAARAAGPVGGVR